MRVNVHAWKSSFGHMAEHLQAMMNAMEGPHYFRSHGPVSWRPKLNLYETADRHVICIELAGMPREEIDVWTSDGVLHISGDRRKPVLPEDPTDVGVHLMEIDSGRFHRQVPLPPDADLQEVSAVYRQGYLWITLHRKADDSESPAR